MRRFGMSSSSKNPFLSGGYPLKRYDGEERAVLVLHWVENFESFRLEVPNGLRTGPEVCIDPNVAWNQRCRLGGRYR